MFCLKNLYITEELINSDKTREFKEDMDNSFNVCVVPNSIEEFRAFAKEETELTGDSMLLSSNSEILNFARAIGIAALPCAENNLDDYVGYEFALQEYADMDADYIDKSYRRLRDIPWEILRTERMIIREETEDDLPELYKIYESEHIKRFIEPLLPDIEAEKEYVRKYRNYIYKMYEFGIWIAEDKDTHEIIGRMGLEPKTYEDNVEGVELGYIVGAKFLRKGYCMEGCRAILKYAKDVLNLPEIYVIIRTENVISQEIAEKLGFVYDTLIIDRNRIMKRYKIAFNGEI